jgi:quercetin dioxygenase-like cupin family protein
MAICVRFHHGEKKTQETQTTSQEGQDVCNVSATTFRCDRAAKGNIVLNCMHLNLEQLVHDDVAALQMADEGCPNESMLSNDLDAMKLATRPDKPQVCKLVDLPAEILALEAQAQPVMSKTLLKADDLRVVLIVFNNAAKMREHHADARISLQVLNGAVRVQVGELLTPLQTGSLMAIEPSITHAIEALQPSALLMTMAWPTASTLRLIPHRGYS